MRLILFLLSLQGTAMAGVAEQRIAIIVGANVGLKHEEPLRYAERDAERVRDVLVDIGAVRAQRALLIKATSAQEVLAAIAEVRGRAAELDAAGFNVTLLFYFSGHGDEDALHINGRSLALSAVRAALSGVPAQLRLSIIDACRTSNASKGLALGPTFSLRDANDAHGTIELRSAAPGEAAQESDELGSSVFSHYLVSGLRGGGDEDRDGRVTFLELYHYVYGRTLLRTGAARKDQHPEYAVAIHGVGDIVLSEPASSPTTLEVLDAAEYLVFATPSLAVVGELRGAGKLGLPVGHYIVLRRTDEGATVTEVDLPWGGAHVLKREQFRSRALEHLVSRGGRLERDATRAFSLRAEIGVAASPSAAEQPGFSGALAFARSFGAMAVGARVGVDTAHTKVVNLTGLTVATTFGPTFAYAFNFGPCTFAPELAIEARLGVQRMSTTDTLLRADSALARQSLFLAGQARLTLGLSVALGAHVALVASPSVGIMVRTERRASAEDVVLRPLIHILAGVKYAL